MPFFVYILKSINHDKFYIGHSDDVEKRLIEHNRGKNIDSFTFKYRPWEIVHVEAFESKTEAIKRELKIKSWKSKVAISILIMGA